MVPLGTPTKAHDTKKGYRFSEKTITKQRSKWTKRTNSRAKGNKTKQPLLISRHVLDHPN